MLWPGLGMLASPKSEAGLSDSNLLPPSGHLLAHQSIELPITATCSRTTKTSIGRQAHCRPATESLMQAVRLHVRRILRVCLTGKPLIRDGLVPFDFPLWLFEIQSYGNKVSMVRKSCCLSGLFLLQLAHPFEPVSNIDLRISERMVQRPRRRGASSGTLCMLLSE
jgi:hypothetical protein